MPFFIRPIAVSVRSVAIAALLGSTIPRSTPWTAALAQSAPTPTLAAASATETKGETVEQRITNLHTALKITSDEESKWNGVAQAMREERPPAWTS